MPQLENILKRYWGYDTFRPLQKEIITSVLNGNDTLALLPTGGGKSICFQVPALAKEGLCIVVSPLIALMKDQVENLKKRDIPAMAIYSGMSRADVIRTLKNATGDYHKFLYVSPERLETSLFNEYLPAMNVSLIAVDESHCISQWGYDFRPSYLRIAELRKELPNVPVIALTASATEEVQQDICAKLTSPLTPLRRSQRGGQPLQHYPQYSVVDVVQFENARKNRKESTVAEEAIWEVLRNHKTGHKFRRQHPIENFIVDFVCLEKGLIIEIDGAYHNTENQRMYDEYRTKVLEQKGFQVIRFTNDEAINHPYEIKNKIKELLTKQKQAQIIEKASPLYISNGEGQGVRWHIFKQSFERPNLSYSVFKVDSKLNKLVDIVKKVPGTSIVYCKSRKRTTEIMQLLKMHGLSTENYHAGLTAEERNRRQKDWIDSKVQCIVCTNAFGMGIDKPDVRLVVHVDPPDCLENYYQEAGRAGRDGNKAYAVLLYDERDVEEIGQLHTTRFPSFETIKSVYNALVNFLQIPVYTGEGQSFSFHFETFIKNFNLNTSEALYALKALESDGWLDFNERSFTPSTLVFTTSKEGLYAFYKSHPEHEQLLTTLLRTYGGIFDFPAFISENLVSKLVKQDEAVIKQQLQKVASYGIIRYTPQNDAPQIIFRKNRVKAEELSFDIQAYNKRKEAFVRRTQNMTGYILSKDCRSRFIAAYFGDNTAKPCRICDICLNKAPKEISPEEFEKYSAIIHQSLKHSSLTTEELIAELKGLKKEKAWKIIQYLQSENKIEAGHNGLIRLK